MKLDEQMSKIIAELEFLIGSECYNPSSYDGWNDIEGCDFRYPVNVPREDGKYIKVKGNINKTALIDPKDITPAAITYIKYRFGANELFIGKGLLKVMSYLENRYGLDFNELEAKVDLEK